MPGYPHVNAIAYSLSRTVVASLDLVLQVVTSIAAGSEK